MTKKKIKIREEDKLIKEIELDTESILSDIRNILENEIKFDFIFLNEDGKEEIKKEDESVKTLDDILDGKNLYLKKEIFKRTMLGEKVEPKNGLDFYVFPQEELTYTEEQRSINIMVIGETGVGKSTWLHCFLNYLQGIQIEEKNRYYLFDEKKLQEEYNRTHPEKQKSSGASVTDKPAIYNIKPTKVSKDPIRLIDTAGFGDTRGEEYDKKITDDIKELFTKKIDYLNAVCIIFKATETRAHDRAKQILDKLFLLFEKGIKDNIIIIFTFVDDFDNVENLPAFKTLNDEKSPFRNILGPIENLPHFEFNNLAYSTNNVKQFSIVFDKCRTNFDKLIKKAFNLKRFSLEDTKKVLEDRSLITGSIKLICSEMIKVINKITILMQKRDDKNEKKEKLKSLEKSENIIVEKPVVEKIPHEESYIEHLSSGWYVLYCNSCNKVCHDDCKGPEEGYHSDEYGCKMITIVKAICKMCGCHYKQHSFHDYIEKTRIVEKEEIKIIQVEDPEKKASEEKKKEQREKIKNQLSENEKEIKNLEDEVNKTLKISLEEIKEIASKENQLNEIALKKYENYGFSKKILDESFQEIKNEQTKNEVHNEIIECSNKINKVFNNTFSRIDSISSDEDIIKEMKDELFKKKKI